MTIHLVILHDLFCRYDYNYNALFPQHIVATVKALHP